MCPQSGVDVGSGKVLVCSVLLFFMVWQSSGHPYTVDVIHDWLSHIRVAVKDTIDEMTTMMCDVQEQSQHYELLLELPPEILDCILLQFCDGKALSTLALTFATSHRYQFHLERLHRIKRLLFSQLAEDLQLYGATLPVDSERFLLKSRHTHILRWLESVERTSHQHLHNSGGEPLSVSMRILSEDLAAIDFLRRRGMQRPGVCYGPKWGAWPTWIGNIRVHSLLTHSILSCYVVLLTSGDARTGNPFFDGSFSPEKMQGSTAQFRIEPRNGIAVPPWGELVGLTADDDRELKKLANLLDTAGPNNAAVNFIGFDRGQFSDNRAPLSNVKIVTLRQALQGYEQLQFPPPSSIHGWAMQVQSAFSAVQIKRAPLICVWGPDDADVVIKQNPREDMFRMIQLMKCHERHCNKKNLAA
jgi:hypothetical protein